MEETNTDKKDKKDNNDTKKEIDGDEKKNEEKKSETIEYLKLGADLLRDGASYIFNYLKDKNSNNFELEKRKIENENNRINKEILELKEKLKKQEEEEIKKRKKVFKIKKIGN